MSERPPLIGVALTLAGIAVLAAVVVAIGPLREGVGDAVSGDTGALRAELRGLDFTGVLIVYGLALVHVVLWYPTEILNAAVGYVYGFWVAMPMIMGAWLLNGVIGYWVGRHAARPLLYRIAGQARFERLERVAARGGATLLLAMRLIPIIPFSLFSYVAGAAHVPLWRFTWTTAVGYIPITAVFVYLGSELEELSVTDPILLIGTAILIALLLLTRRISQMIAEPEAEPGVPEAEPPERA